jgi:hypothetical protein
MQHRFEGRGVLVTGAASVADGGISFSTGQPRLARYFEGP